ncbi:MAG: prepilin peptidase [Minisyncoccota bacterium]
MPFTLLLAFLVFGLIIGSFLNVVVCRLHDAETLLGRSLCRHCQHQIRWYDNIPLISFILLCGKCRDCAKRISWQYPVLELLTGILFVFFGWTFLDNGTLMDWIRIGWLFALISCFIVIATYDFQYMEVPINGIFLSALLIYGFLAFSFLVYQPLFIASDLWLGILGGIVIGSFFFLLVWMSRETWMGWGDVWLGIVVGSLVGLPLILPMLTIACGLGAMTGIFSVFFYSKSLKSQIPFAPFLIIGALVVLLLAELFPDFFTLYNGGFF